MKTRRSQFGVRENTASSRQHAPRLAVEDSVLQPDLLLATERPDKSTRELMPPINEAFELSLTEPNKGATGGEPSRGTTLATESTGQSEPNKGATGGEPSRGTTLATESTGQSGIERPLTCDEAAELVRVHPKTIKRMARDRRLPGHFRFGRWFFYASELDGWMRTELHSSRHSCR